MPYPNTSERLHGLDALRGFALLLGVALHAAMAYLPGSEAFWVVSDSERSRVLSGGFHWIHSFRMTLFFLLAGFFGRMLLHRLGSWRFARDRFKRITLPLLSLWLPIFVTVVAVAIWNTWLKNGGSFPDNPEPMPAMTATNFPLMHLWFLYLLTIFYTATLAVRALFRGVDRGGHMQTILDRVLRIVGGPLAPLLLSVPAALALLSIPTWWHWFGIPTPDMSLIPNPTACIAYGMAFLGGWALQRLPDLLDALPRRWPLNLAIALLSSGICFYQLGLVSPSVAAAPGTATTLYAFAYVTASWTWSLALIGLALRFLDGHSPVRRYLADASYWIYIVHLPLAMAAQVLASRYQAPWWVEYPLVLAAVLAVCLLSYQLLVRHTWIGGWLNGRRVPRSQMSAQVGRAAL